MTVLRRHVGAAMVALGLLGAACGGGGDDVTVGIEQLAPSAMPTELFGLRVEIEPMDDVLGTIERPFVESAGLFSLREGDELMATLQVSRFTDDAPWSASFRRSVISQIGSRSSSEIRVGDHDVHLTAGDRQSIAVWFRDRTLLILSARDDYGHPRGLLRAALELEL